MFGDSVVLGEEVKTRFTLVSLIPDSESSLGINDFLERNKKTILHPKQKFHSTLHLAVENPLFRRERIVEKISSKLPIRVSPRTYSLDVFGDRYLVLRYENSQVEELHGLLLEEGLRQMICDYPGGLSPEEEGVFEEYLPQRRGVVYGTFRSHMTLAKNFDPKDLERLTGLPGEIVFYNFGWKI